MTFVFGKIGFVYSIFDDEDEEEQEDIFIEEIRYCDCFFDEFQYLLMKNNFKIGFKEIFFCTIPNYQFSVVRCVLILSQDLD